MRGKKTPNEIKKIQGTQRSNEALNNPFVPDGFGGIPVAPEDLGASGSKIWDVTVRELHDKGMLTKIELGIIKQYCISYEMIEQCNKEIKDNGFIIEHTNKAKETNRIQNPAVIILNKYMDTFIKISDRFGLNPLARNKIEVPEKPKEDDITKLLDRKNK